MPILIQHFMMKKTFLYLVLAMMPVLASAQQMATSAPKASEATAVPTRVQRLRLQSVSAISASKKSFVQCLVMR